MRDRAAVAAECHHAEFAVAGVPGTGDEGAAKGGVWVAALPRLS